MAKSAAVREVLACSAAPRVQSYRVGLEMKLNVLARNLNQFSVSGNGIAILLCYVIMISIV